MQWAAGRARFRGGSRNARDLVVLAIPASIRPLDRTGRAPSLEPRLRATGSRHIRLPIDAALHRDQLHRVQVAPSSNDNSDAIGGQTDEIKVVEGAGAIAERMKCHACTKKADSVRFAIGLNDLSTSRSVCLRRH